MKQAPEAYCRGSKWGKLLCSLTFKAPLSDGGKHLIDELLDVLQTLYAPLFLSLLRKEFDNVIPINSIFFIASSFESLD